jgi:ankyrin repeat protein
MAKLSMNVLDSLTTPAPNDFVDSLHKLPEIPTKIYQELWARIQEQDEDTVCLVKRIFAWVTYSGRNLAPGELQHGLYFHDDRTSLPRDISGYLVDPDEIERICLGVICLKKETNVMAFHHHTAEIFFPEYFDLEFSGQAHEWIATACLNHIVSTARNHSARAQELPLHDYAALCWGGHVRDSRRPSMESKVIDLLLDEAFANQATWSFVSAYPSFGWSPRQYKSPQAFDSIHPLHLAAYFGLDSVIDKLVSEHYISVDTRTHSDSWTPIRWALHNAQEDTVNLLIWKGADLELQYEDGNTLLMAVLCQALPSPPEDSHFTQCSAEQAARVHFGDYYETKNFDLLDRYPDRFPACLYHILYNSNCLDTSNYSGLTALCIAAQSKSLEPVHHLTQMGASINTRLKNGLTPLLAALQPRGSFKFSDMIMRDESRCHLGISSRFQSLEHRSRYGPYGPKLLVDDATGDPILWVSEELVLPLIGPRVDLEVKDDWDRTALSYAAEYGFEKAVEELLRLHADTETTDHCGRTPLIWSLRRSAAYRCLVENIDISNDARVHIGHWVDLNRLPQSSHETRDQRTSFLSRSSMITALAEKTNCVSHRDNSGQSAVDLANGEGLHTLAGVLERRVRASNGCKCNNAASPVRRVCKVRFDNHRLRICQHAPGAISVDNLFLSGNARVAICSSPLEHKENITTKLDRRRPTMELRVLSVRVSDNARLMIGWY